MKQKDILWMGLVVIFLLSLSSQVFGCSTKRCICGIPYDSYEPLIPSQHYRVGRITVTNEYPWNIFIYKRGQFVCGGSLIDTSHVLTAAHCVAEGTTAEDIAVYAYSGLPVFITVSPRFIFTQTEWNGMKLMIGLGIPWTWHCWS